MEVSIDVFSDEARRVSSGIEIGITQASLALPGQTGGGVTWIVHARAFAADRAGHTAITAA
jgi:hypothetical protein